MKAIKFPRKAFAYLSGTILSLFAASLINTGCITTREEIPSTLEVSKHSLDLSFSDAEDNFTVTSNSKWTVTRDASWLIVSPSSGFDNGTVKVEAVHNTNVNAEPRKATIIVSNGIPNKEQTIAVTQNSPSLTVSGTSLSFSNNAESKSFTITSNTSWTVISSASSWLTVSQASGSNDGTITVTAAANTSETQRTAKITVSINISGNEITSSINVTQDREILNLSLSSLNFSTSGGSRTFSIDANTSWTVSIDSTNWLSVTPSTGNNDGTITVTAESNTSTSERTATITVMSSGLTRTISVYQSGIPFSLTVSSTSLSFSSSSESKTFTINSNTSWTVSRGSASWLTVSPASGSDNGTINVTAEANTSTTERTATITVSGGGISRNVTVSQSAFVEPEMIFVQGGTFTMGCTSEQGGDCNNNEMPTHQVTLNDFYIGKFEVTQGLWKAVMGNNPSNFPNGDNYPVEMVSWNDIVGTNGTSMVINNITYYANGFIYKLNQLTGKQYRLPTEAEWEYAARGDNKSGSYKYSGSNSVSNVAWYRDIIPIQTWGPQPVGTKFPNELNIYDMSGNVWEWCSDWHSNYSSDSQTNPTGPLFGSHRVARGGGWSADERSSRISCRSSNTPDDSNNGHGFRLARSSN